MTIEELFNTIPKENLNQHYWNRYKKFVISIINKGNRNIKFKEAHHIIPRSINQNLCHVKENIIELTLREHYIAHLILTYCFLNNYKYKMYFAFDMICTTRKNKLILNSRQYELVRKLHKAACKNYGRINGFKGAHHTEETKKLLSQIKKKAIENGTFNPKFPVCKGPKNGRYGKHWSNEHKQQISNIKKQQIWITKECKDKIIFKSELESYKNLGWQRGRYNGKSTLNKIWVTNDIINKIIPKQELQNYLDLGFRRGKIKKSKL